jgi:hypothetical protein
VEFAKSYFEARDKFRNAALAAGATLDRIKLRARGPGGEELTIDLAWFGDLNSPKIIIHSSGLHGVEGFAGSAVQVEALERGKFTEGCLFVHCLNPFGMSWLRRVNESNVDLNRNYLYSGEQYRDSSDKYARIDSIINSSAATPLYFFAILRAALKYKYGWVRSALLEGQFGFPKGLLYGGRELEESWTLYREWLKKNVRGAKTLIAVDVHTGIGKFGEEVLFCYTEIPGFDIGRRLVQPDAPVGYRIHGGHDCLINELFPSAKRAYLTEEIGTYPNLKLLNALRLENQAFQQYGRPGAYNRGLLAVFNPDHESWRRRVIEQGLATLDGSLKWLAAQ